MSGFVYWITGFSGVGKTTIGTRLYYRLKKIYPHVVLLDGDVIKKLFCNDETIYTKEGRLKRAYQYSELCRLLANQGIKVICCTIAMFDEVREWNRRNISNYLEVYIDVDVETAAKRDTKGLYKKFKTGRDVMVGLSDYAELPKYPDVVIKNNASEDIESYIDEILLKTADNRDILKDYWNAYYERKAVSKHPSDFAKFISKYVKPGYKLIDLGCGNGRDSIYFHDIGLKVTAIDSSKEAIASIDNALSIFAVCDDFVTAKALYCVDYDYCYARWSIHSINQTQQDELLPNIFNALKDDGLLFVEARTVNDSKYGYGKKLGENEFFSDGHYRRFIDVAVFKEQLIETGFEVIYCEESNEFSLMANDSPTLMRLIAKKMAT